MLENPFSRFSVATPPLLVFDLDGTLIDSLDGITRAANRVLDQHALPRITNDDIRRAIGDGARKLLERTMPELVGRLSVETVFGEFREVYLEESLRDPQLYSGALAFLDATAADHSLAVLTNKPLAISEAMLAALGIADRFAAVIAPENARAPKPDPAGFFGLLEQLKSTGDQSILFGDSTKDFAAGHGVGALTIGMRDGYYTPGEPDPDFWADDFSQIHHLWTQWRNS